MTEHPSDPRSTGDREPAIRVIMMPKDTNALGTIFGGIILSYIDQAGAVAYQRVATASLRIVNRPRHRKHFTPLLPGQTRGNQ